MESTQTLVSVKPTNASSSSNDDDENRAKTDENRGTDTELVITTDNDNENENNPRGEEIVRDEERRRSNASMCSVEVVDLELGICDDDEKKVLQHLSEKSEKDCRICHMSLDVTNLESGVPIELGCSCKDDLAAAHKHCAETWFKIKGNIICEVCGSIAGNVGWVVEVETEESRNEVNGSVNQALRTVGPRGLAEVRSFWQGHRFLNFLLACMVFAFVISWLFHFNVPST